MWYLDCYCYGAACGRDFPVNSYEVRLSRETKGQCPVRAEFHP